MLSVLSVGALRYALSVSDPMASAYIYAALPFFVTSMSLHYLRSSSTIRVCDIDLLSLSLLSAYYIGLSVPRLSPHMGPRHHTQPFTYHWREGIGGRGGVKKSPDERWMTTVGGGGGRRVCGNLHQLHHPVIHSSSEVSSSGSKTMRRIITINI